MCRVLDTGTTQGRNWRGGKSKEHDFWGHEQKRSSIERRHLPLPLVPLRPRSYADQIIECESGGIRTR